MVDTVEQQLRDAVQYLAGEVGPRSCLDLSALNAAAEFIEREFIAHGLTTQRQAFEYAGNTYYNIIAEKGTEGDPLIIGAHYDTVEDSPGADDNASGVAGMLELARLHANADSKRALRFVAFCLEEPPAYATSRMGSYVYAKEIHERGEKIRGMISLEMLGYYSEDEDSQTYPLAPLRWIYPDKGNFISFVGNLSSRVLIKRAKKEFKKNSTLPLESLSTVSIIPGVSFSDHDSFWKMGYPAFMITDTAFYRNPYYHAPGDTPDTLNYGKMAELVLGLHKTFQHI